MRISSPPLQLIVAAVLALGLSLHIWTFSDCPGGDLSSMGKSHHCTDKEQRPDIQTQGCAKLCLKCSPTLFSATPGAQDSIKTAAIPLPSDISAKNTLHQPPEKPPKLV